jgi:hypothetical protein
MRFIGNELDNISYTEECEGYYGGLFNGTSCNHINLEYFGDRSDNRTQINPFPEKPSGFIEREVKMDTYIPDYISLILIVVIFTLLLYSIHFFFPRTNRLCTG